MVVVVVVVVVVGGGGGGGGGVLTYGVHTQTCREETRAGQFFSWALAQCF